MRSRVAASPRRKSIRLGSFRVGLYRCAFGNRAEVVSLAVDPAVRCRGVASALMNSCLRRLRLRGISRLALMVKVTNVAARAFYEKYQFEKVRTVRGYYEDGADGWLMA